MNRSLLKSYALLTPALLAVFAGLYLVVERAAAGRVDPFALLAPLIALVGLTGVVWLLMFVVRNLAVVRGVATVRYYQAYCESDAPQEWIERPARAFMNLLELPVLFYVLCLLMLVTDVCDTAQVQLAWIFVGLRTVHASIYIGINHVPARLGAYVASSAVLAVMWWRFAGSMI